MNNQHKLQIDKLGTPGIPGELVLVNVFINDNTPDEVRLKDKSQRSFIVKAKLSKSPQISERIDTSVNLEAGDSYILAHKDAIYSKLKTNDGEFQVLHNKERELSGIKYECLATSIQEAKFFFNRSVSFYLDYISYTVNVPIFIPLTECIDIKNNINAINYICPYPRATVNPHFKNLNQALLPIYALYREAKNSISSFYKFLCYYKILEGIFNHIRPETFKEARKNNIDLPQVKELVPKIEELLDINNDTAGKSIKEIYDKRFTPEFRNKVAHYILDSGQILNVSDYSTSANFSRELLLIEICVRIIVNNQEKYCEQLNQKSL
ncbi:MAG: hypothetical protein JXA79_01130 [Deltaproteobacteria bacterium]|nr:hypothetical protein [Deltaproteobacteria bacterium]